MEKARVTLTMECEPSEILVAPEGNTEAAMAKSMKHGNDESKDEARLKQAIERTVPPSE